MPELGEHVAAFGLNRFHDGRPSGYLSIGIEARRAEPPATGERNVRSLGDNQASITSALLVVEDASSRPVLNLVESTLSASTAP